MAEKLLFIACGGGIGAALQYVISAWASAHGGAVFPYGTALVNIIGSFLIGLSASYFAVHATLPPPTVKLFIVTGILGGFTTFSTYNLEFITLLCTGSFTYACTYALLNIVITFLCCFAGLIIGELLF